MQWEAMKPVMPAPPGGDGNGSTMDIDGASAPLLRSSSRARDPSKARKPLAGGKLVGTRKKTTKKSRKKEKKRAKRHK